MMYVSNLLSLSLVWSILTCVSGSGVVRISDSELLHASNENVHVLAFLHAGNCDSPECMYSLSELNRVIEAGTVPGLRVFHIPQSSIAQKLKSSPEPVVVFYRNSIPILYDDGMILRDEILTWMENNKEKHTTRLDSSNFEHLTQASTGATTGDWLILFHKKGCDDLMPIWEAVASRLKHKLNVAEVDMASSSELRTRFQISRCPSVFFFRHGKMYSYELSVRDVQSFVSFAEGWYTNAPSRAVPAEPSPFDVFTDKVVSWLKALDVGTTFLPIVAVALVLVLVLVLFCLCCAISNRQTPQEKKLK